MHWKGGLVQDVYLDPSELVAISNYKKSLISLFQFQIFDGEHNETDISGICEVLYESLSVNEFRKIKRRCEGDSQLSPGKARRSVRYTLEKGELQTAYADEVLELGVAGIGVKARSWVRLQRVQPPPAAAVQAASLEAALGALPHTLRLADPPLGLVDDPNHPDYEDDNATLEELLTEYWKLLSEEEEAGGGGTAEGAHAVLRLVSAVRRTEPRALRAILTDPARHPVLVGLCRAVGLSGSGAAFSAAASALQLSEGVHGPAASALLAGAALAGRADSALAVALARLARRQPAALPAAVAAAAAADAAEPEPRLAKQLRDQIAQALAKCKVRAAALEVLIAASEGREVAAAGLLRRGTVRLLAEHPPSAASRRALAADHAVRGSG
ncbi:hypothetical protein ACJJTC_009585 [Scirpophaga incertulas]